MAAAVEHDSGALALDGGVHDNFFTAAKANDFRMIAVGAMGRRFGYFGVYLVIVLQFRNLEHFVIRPVEYIGHARPG